MRALFTALRFTATAVKVEPGRIGWLTIVLAVSVSAWVVLSVLASPFVQPRVTTDIGGVFISSANMGAVLPVKYAKRVEAISGARHVAYASGLAVICNDAAPAVSINAWGGPGAATQVFGLPEQTGVTEAATKRWVADRMGVVIGTQVAKDCGWRAGMGVSPNDAFTGRPVELHIIAIRPPQKNPIADSIVIGHYDYFNAVMPFTSQRNTVRTIVTGTRNPRDAPALAARIEAAFAHDDPPVEANTMAEFQNGLV